MCVISITAIFKNIALELKFFCKNKTIHHENKGSNFIFTLKHSQI
jgi:hypothetical protein